MKNNYISKPTILIVAAGQLQVPAIQLAKSKGLYVVSTDRNPKALGFEYADEKVVMDIKDVKGHISLARELKKRTNLIGIFTEGADVEVTVAKAAQAVGLPGISPQAAFNCNNKVAMRKLFKKTGLPGPDFAEVTSIVEAKKEAKRIGFPLVVKAVDNSGSRGVKKIKGLDELPEAFKDAKKASSTNTVLLEECLTGPEQSVDTLVYKGKHYRCNIADRLFGFHPYPIEIGFVVPTKLSEKIQDELYQLIERAAKTVGIDFGAAKADTILTKKGPIILEMTARLSGGYHCQYVSPLAFGTNDIKAAMDIAVGKDLDMSDIRPKWEKHVACLCPFPSPGRITAIEGVEGARKLPGVRHIFFRMGVGDIVQPYHTCVDRVCFVIAEGETRKQAINRVKGAVETIKIKTKKINDSTLED